MDPIDNLQFEYESQKSLPKRWGKYRDSFQILLIFGLALLQTLFVWAIGDEKGSLWSWKYLLLLLVFSLSLYSAAFLFPGLLILRIDKNGVFLQPSLFKIYRIPWEEIEHIEFTAHKLHFYRKGNKRVSVPLNMLPFEKRQELNRLEALLGK